MYTATSAESALETVKLQQPEVLMVDYQLGEITGIELIEQIRSSVS